MRQAVLLLVMATLIGCGPDPDADGRCTGPADCAPLEDPPCELACAAVATQMCVRGNCLMPDLGSALLRADVWLHHTLTGQVQSMVYALLDLRMPEAAAANITCADVKADQPSFDDASVNVVHSGVANFADTAGTGFFADTALGNAPAGQLLLVARGHEQRNGQGALTSRACVDVLIQSDQPIKVDLRLAP